MKKVEGRLTNVNKLDLKLLGNNPKRFWTNVSVIGEGAFESADIKEIEIPDSIKAIEAGAFMHCWSLEKVKLPENLESLSGLEFWDCRKLKSINLPKNLTSVERGLLFACKSLKKVVVPAGVKSIGMCAFCGCSNLEEIVLPQNISDIEKNAFLHCNFKYVYKPVGKNNIVFSQSLPKDVEVEGSIEYKPNLSEAYQHSKDETYEEIVEFAKSFGKDNAEELEI